jgi:hypothetical protein
MIMTLNQSFLIWSDRLGEKQLVLLYKHINDSSPSIGTPARPIIKGITNDDEAIKLPVEVPSYQIQQTQTWEA